jgi:hypothetical protein
MANKLASILESADTLLLTDGSIVALDSPKFLTWLENNKSFRFDCGLAGKDGFTARKEKSGYWYAYKRIDGKLHKSYIGNLDCVTIPKLKEVAEKLHNPPTPRSKKQLHNNSEQRLHTSDEGLHTEVTESLYATIGNQAKAIEAMQRALTALVERVERLEAPKKPESLPTEIEVTDGYTILLEKRVNELEDANRRLTNQVEEMREELITAHGQNIDAHGQTAEVLKENVELGAMLQKREAELETAQQQIAQLEQSHELQRSQSQPQQPTLTAKTLDDFLAGLKLGKQSPDYKAAKKWIARFVEFVDSSLKL